MGYRSKSKVKENVREHRRYHRPFIIPNRNLRSEGNKDLSSRIELQESTSGRELINYDSAFERMMAYICCLTIL